MPKASNEAKRKLNQRNRLLQNHLLQNHLLQKSLATKITYFSERTLTFAGILILVHLSFGCLLSRNIRFITRIHIESDLFHLTIS